MTGFLSELGKRLAERWLALVVLPGLLFVAAVGCASVLGQASAVDASRLNERATAVARLVSGHDVRIVLALVGMLLGSLASAFLARMTATGILLLWTEDWPWPIRWLGARLTALRRKRAVSRASRAGVNPVSSYLPRRPTWISDRLRLIGSRIDAEYGLAIDVVWPRIWLASDASTRQPVGEARGRLDMGALVAGWGVLYLAVGVVWWPAAVGGATAVLYGWRRARAACDEFALAVESMVDLRVRALAQDLGVGLPASRMTPAEGTIINSILDKGA